MAGRGIISFGDLEDSMMNLAIATVSGRYTDGHCISAIHDLLANWRQVNARQLAHYADCCNSSQDDTEFLVAAMNHVAICSGTNDL